MNPLPSDQARSGREAHEFLAFLELGLEQVQVLEQGQGQELVQDPRLPSLHPRR